MPILIVHSTTKAPPKLTEGFIFHYLKTINLYKITVFSRRHGRGTGKQCTSLVPVKQGLSERQFVLT
jgi:hypothetical protein